MIKLSKLTFEVSLYGTPTSRELQDLKNNLDSCCEDHGLSNVKIKELDGSYLYIHVEIEEHDKVRGQSSIQRMIEKCIKKCISSDLHNF